MIQKRYFFLVVCVLALVCSSAPVVNAAKATKVDNKITVFTKESCSFCEEALDWLNTTGLPYTNLNVKGDPTITKLYEDLLLKHDLPKVLPITVIGNDVIVGFDEANSKKIKEAYKKAAKKKTVTIEGHVYGADTKFKQKISVSDLEKVISNEVSAAWKAVIYKQYQAGYQRFEEQGYYSPIISDYVIKNGDVYYSPIERDANAVASPKLLSKNPKQFLVARGGVAYDGKSVFYRGKTVAKSKQFKELAFDRYAFAGGLYVMKDNLDKKTPRYELLKAFDKVNVAKLKEVSELTEKYYPVADGNYTPRWYRDGKYFYCVEGKGVVSQRLQEPVRIDFLSSGIAPTSGAEDPQWLKVDNTKERGYIQFMEEKFGRKYDSRCNLI